MTKTAQEGLTIAIHDSASSLKIVKFIKLNQFPEEIQEMHDEGVIAGAHVANGHVVVVDIWQEEHQTQVPA